MRLKKLGANETILCDGTREIFFSYETPVAAWVAGKLYITDEFHSRTTSKHINRFIQRFSPNIIPEEKYQGFFDSFVERIELWA